MHLFQLSLVVLLKVHHDLFGTVFKFLEDVLALPDSLGKTWTTAKEEVVVRVVLVRPRLAILLVLIKNKIHHPWFNLGETAVVVVAVGDALITQPVKRVSVHLSRSAEPDVSHDVLVPPHAHDQFSRLDWVLHT